MLLFKGSRESDEKLEALEWILARAPDSGYLMAGPVWTFETAEFVLADPLVVFYTFDDETTTLLSIQRIRPTSED